jgi:beta-glucanase (GH16 family)
MTVALVNAALLLLLCVIVNRAEAALPSSLPDEVAVRSGVADNANTTARQSSSWPKGLPSFFQSFTGTSSLPGGWWTSGTYANGYPFASGWDPSFFALNAQDGLNLLAKRQTFNNPMAQSPQTSVYPFTSGELRSSNFYGYGCFSTCMKPAKASGVSSSFFIYNGPYDTPGDAGRAANGKFYFLCIPARPFFGFP